MTKIFFTTKNDIYNFFTSKKSSFDNHFLLIRFFKIFRITKKLKLIQYRFFHCFVLVDTEIPILPQSPSPPPEHKYQPQPHQQQQHRTTSNTQQQQSSTSSNGSQLQARPLLHGLLSGTHIPNTPYHHHRGYSTSSTGKNL